MSTDLTGKFACTRCGHDQYEHNLIVGCPHCKCAATPGEAGNETHFPGTSAPYRGPIVHPTEYLYAWQAKRCTCAEDGSAYRCDFHTQEDFLAANAVRDDEHRECKRRTAVAWSAFLDLAIETGTLQEVLDYNPDLRRRLSTAVGKALDT